MIGFSKSSSTLWLDSMELKHIIFKGAANVVAYFTVALRLLFDSPVLKKYVLPENLPASTFFNKTLFFHAQDEMIYNYLLLYNV
jgi:hypothetical protein